MNATISPLSINTGAALVTRIDYEQPTGMSANIITFVDGRSITVYGHDQVAALRDALTTILEGDVK